MKTTQPTTQANFCIKKQANSSLRNFLLNTAALLFAILISFGSFAQNTSSDAAQSPQSPEPPKSVSAPESTIKTDGDAMLTELFDLMNIAENFEPIMNQMTAQMNEMFPDDQLEAESFTAVMESMQSMVLDQGLDGLIDQMKTVYGHHLTEGEISGLLEFYKSDAGIAFIEKQPQIAADMISVSMDWAMQFGERLMKDFEDPNSELTKMLEQISNDSYIEDSGEE